MHVAVVAHQERRESNAGELPIQRSSAGSPGAPSGPDDRRDRQQRQQQKQQHAGGVADSRSRIDDQRPPVDHLGRRRVWIAEVAHRGYASRVLPDRHRTGDGGRSGKYRHNTDNGASRGTPAPLPQQKGSKQQPVLGLERQESEPQPAAEVGAAPQRQKRLGQRRSQKQHRLAKQQSLQDR